MAQVTATLLAKSGSVGSVVANTNVTTTIGTTGVTVGQWIAVWVSGAATGQTYTVTDSGSNTYTGQTQVTTTGTIETGQWFVCQGATAALTASSSSISVKRSTASTLSYQAYVLPNATAFGLAGVQYTGSSAVATTSMAVQTPATNFTSVSESLTLFGCCWGNTNAATAGTGFTLLDLSSSSSTNARGSGAFFRQSTAGETVTPAATITTAGNTYASAALSFASATAGLPIIVMAPRR